MKLITLLFLCATCQLSNAGYWENEILKFEQQDISSGYQKNGVLFTGSSTIRLWQLDIHFKNSCYINRGFGGSQVKDLITYFDRIIKKYSPKKIIIYSGENDLDYGKSVDEVLSDFNELISRLKKINKLEIIWILPKKTIKRSYLNRKVQILNHRIYTRYINDKKIKLIDLNLLLNLPILSSQYFIKDGIHLNSKAYRNLSTVINKLLD